MINYLQYLGFIIVALIGLGIIFILININIEIIKTIFGGKNVRRKNK